MGIFTDYGRYYKCREFKNWIESDGGIWFGFGVGSKNWDYFVLNGSSSVMNTPVAVPRPSASLKKWLAEEKGVPVGELVLNDNEKVFLDKSYTPENNQIPTFNQIPDDFDGSGLYSPDDEDIPSELYLDSWQGDITGITYPELTESAFPQSYKRDYNDVDWNANLNVVPTNSEEYESWSKARIVKDSLDNGNPLGFLSFVRGTTRFVVPTDEPANNINIFVYGSQSWKMINEADALELKAHHLLLTCTVMPMELHNKEVVEHTMLVRQVEVCHFPVIDGLTNTQKRSIYNKDCYFKSNLNPIPDDKIIIPTDPSDEHIEVLINDFLSGRYRQVNQSDRYGYIIGF